MSDSQSNVSSFPRLRRLLLSLASSDLRRRIVAGASWAVVGAILARLLTMISAVLVARVLGRDDFGRYGILNATLGVLGPLAGLQLGLTATKHVAELRAADPERAGRILTLTTHVALATGIVTSILLYVLAPWLANDVLSAPEMTNLLRAASPIVFLGALAGAQSGALAGFEAFRSIAQTNIVAAAVALPFMVIGALWAGVLGTTLALVAVQLLHCSLLAFQLRRECRKHGVSAKAPHWRREAGVLFRFSIPSALASLLSGPLHYASTAILVNQPQGFAQMGTFSAATQWRAPVVMLPTTASAVVLPVLSNLEGLGDARRYGRVLRWSLGVNGAFALAVALPICLLSGLIMSAYGPEFRSGSWVVVVMALSGVPLVLAEVLGQVVISKGRMWINIGFHLLWALTLLLLAWSLVPGLGALGLALATLGAWVVRALAVGLLALALLRASPSHVGDGGAREGARRERHAAPGESTERGPGP